MKVLRHLYYNLCEWYALFTDSDRPGEIIWPGWSAIRWLAREHTARWQEMFYMFIVWHVLPRKLVMWAAIHVMAHASQGQWGNETPDSINMMEMLRRWDIPHTGSSTPPSGSSSPTEHKYGLPDDNVQSIPGTDVKVVVNNGGVVLPAPKLIYVVE